MNMSEFSAAAAISAVYIVLSTVCLQANAFSDIVAFGDSLTDDCTMGASQVVDNALNTDQVRTDISKSMLGERLQWPCSTLSGMALAFVFVHR